MLQLGGPDGQRDRGKVVTIDIWCSKAVGYREVAFVFSMGDLTRGCINAQLLVVPSVGLTVVRTKCVDGGRLEDAIFVLMSDGGIPFR